MTMELTGFGKGGLKKPFGSELADKRLKENRVLKNGKPRSLSVQEVAAYVNRKRGESTMAIGALKVIEKETLLKRIHKGGVAVDVYDTKVCIYYPSDKTRVFEVPLSDLISQAVELLGAVPEKESSDAPVRRYIHAPEGCVSLDLASQKLGVTIAKLLLLVPEMKNHGYTVPLINHEGRDFIRKPDLERMLSTKTKLTAFLNRVREERLKK